jgi:acyl transferase domain-containing protein/thioesterase domain-containing protein
MSNSSIAIVGMAGRFPGAPNIEVFWRNLRDGVESIRTLSDTELRAAGVSQEELENPEYVRAAAILDGIELFDASFFGFSPRDASIMDPQHRHFLECAWEAVENAGYTAEAFPGSIGVFAGSGMSSYLIHNLLPNRKLVNSAGLFLLRQTGNDKDVLATRVSYQLNLHGPSVNVQTACSTSLVAIHLACQSLLNHESDMALAGGVTIEIPHGQGYMYRPGEILSRDGHCRAFDAEASGTVFSSGLGLIVLRRLSDALRDRDTIRAVILGTAINNDGARKVGYLAPSVDGQADVITEALGVAGVPADSISYVETHGTGTAVGDPIEVRALTQAYNTSTKRRGFCAIGSLKASIGHLDAAAGVAGLIKTVLALENRKVLPSLNFKSPNPLIDFQNSPFYVNTSLVEWEKNSLPRRAGVTSLGIGGTNAHVIVEEAPPRSPVQRKQSFQLLPVSAKSEAALQNATNRLVAYLRNNPESNLADVAYTLQVGRKSFPVRSAVVGRDAAEAAKRFEENNAKGLISGSAPTPVPSLIFLFSGQGSQHVDMAKHVYEQAHVFRDCFDRCANYLQKFIGVDLRQLVYPPESERIAAADWLNQTSITQPALFALEYSLAQWWMALGLKPRAMLGHSIGEYVAACISGVFSLEDALQTTAIRGRLMQKASPGAMLAVPLPPNEIGMPANLSLAAINGPEQCVVSGTFEAIEVYEKVLRGKGVACQRLQTSHAFHSAMMDPILEEFRTHLQRVTLHLPRVPFLSNPSGTWIQPSEATDPDYWVKQLRGTVRFADCVSQLLSNEDCAFLEIGPGQTLTSLARQQTRKRAKAVASLPHKDDPSSSHVTLLSAVGRLWVNGQTPDWNALHRDEPVGRVPLPTYPFEHKNFWIVPDEEPIRQMALAEPAHEKENKPGEAPGGRSLRFYKRVWKQTDFPSVSASAPACWLIFVDEKGLGKQICTQLRGAGHKVVYVSPGKSYRRSASSDYSIRPSVPADYQALLEDLVKHGHTPQKVVHLWSLTEGAIGGSVEEKLDHTFFSLLYFAQALGREDLSGVDIAVISDRLQPVGDPVAADPTVATLLGPVRVIPREYPGVVCRSIDLNLEGEGLSQHAVQLIAEQCAPFTDEVVAFRRGARWTERFEATELIPNEARSRFKEKGCYIITGGLGGLGLVISRHLAQQFHARLVLIGRSSLPAPQDWDALLQRPEAPPKLLSTLKSLQEIRALGGEVLPLQADVAQLPELQRAWNLAEEKFGKIDGVIHAAGIIEDAPFLSKTAESAARVLAPKVNGTIALDAVTKNKDLDFLVLFSSISSVLPPQGQIDYAAANAFLDTFAEQRQPQVQSINWGLWRGGGMGDRDVKVHPLLEQRVVETENETVFATKFRVDTQWVLSEHRLQSGSAVCPGTAYLEQAAGLLVRDSLSSPLQFEDVFFLAPMVVEDHETREVRARLTREEGSHRFSISSRDLGWTEHATGQIRRISQTAPPPINNLDSILQRCRRQTIQFDADHRTHQETFFSFGPRWRNLKAIHLGKDEALAELELANGNPSDVSNYLMHPALFDLATGSALYLVQNYSQTACIYLPMSYRKLTIYRRFPEKFYSHILSRPENDTGREVVAFQITLFDSDGNALAEIEEFSMRRVDDPAATLVGAKVRRTASPSLIEKEQVPERRMISAEQGAAVLSQILASTTPPVIVVNAGDLPTPKAERQIGANAQPRGAISLEDVEMLLCEWWKELLGLEHVGLDDDFFELGGQSLVVVRLFSKIKKNYGLDFPLDILFELRTVRKIAARIREGAKKDLIPARTSTPVVAIQAKGTKPPLFVISGLGGNVIKFHSLAFYLGEDQPIYGLLPRGLDGKEPFHTRVEDMAAYYVSAIRAMQSQGPYRLVGYSFGGIVAFEVAQQIIIQGDRVSLLGFFDTIEWHYLENVNRFLNPSQRLKIYKARLGEALSSEELFNNLREFIKGKIAHAQSQLLRAIGRPSAPHTGATLEEVNTVAGANYHPKPYPGPLTIFRSTTRRTEEGNDETLGWGGLVKSPVEIHHIASNHFNILQEPSVRILSEKLKKCLDRELETSAEPALERLHS